MRPKHVLIAGATGGIGQAFAQRLVTSPDLTHLMLCAPHASTCAPLLYLQQQASARGTTVWLHDLDITDECSLGKMVATLSSTMPLLDLVINASGLLHEAGLTPEKTATQVSAAAMHRIFAVNAFGPMLLAKALWPWLRAKRPIVFASLSARVGSITDNRLGGWYSYRAAKAAQNQFLRSIAIELGRMNPHSIVLALHPGTTDTRLSRPFQANVAPEKLFSPEFVATQLLQIMENAKVSDSGRFMAWDGQPIAW